MPPIPLALSAYARSASQGPSDRLVNRFFEQPPRQGDLPNLLTRPGLVQFANVGAGPIRGVLRKAGVLGGNAIVVSGGSLYRITTGGVSTYVGLIGGTALVSMDASSAEVKIANGEQLYNYDGVSLTMDAFPDMSGVASVAHLRGFWFAVEAASQKLFVRLPGDVAWDALTFVSAEQEPDKLTAVITLGDELWLFGEDSVETWVLTGAVDPPVQPIPGRTHEKGCLSPDTIAKADQAVFWVSEEGDFGRSVYRGGGNAPERISTHAVEEAMSLVDPLDLRGFVLKHVGHELYVLTVGTGVTFVYDMATQQWSEWSSPGMAVWRAHLGSTAPNGPILLGDRIDGRVWTLEPTVATDDGTPFARLVTGRVQANGGEKARCNRVSLSAGLQAPSGTAQARLRTSDDDGVNWRDHGLRPFAKTGDRSSRTIWNRLGFIDWPGRVFEISDDGAVPTTVRGLGFD